jgi:hypothetical protein
MTYRAAMDSQKADSRDGLGLGADARATTRSVSGIETSQTKAGCPSAVVATL